MRTASSVFSLTSNEFQSSMASLAALRDKINDVRMTLNPQDETRGKLDRVLQKVQQIMGLLHEQEAALKSLQTRTGAVRERTMGNVHERVAARHVHGSVASRVAARFLKAEEEAPEAPAEVEQPLTEEELAEVGDAAFGGKGPFVLPDNHVAAKVVPAGGISCENCKYLSEEGGKPVCKSDGYVQWNGGDPALGGAPNEFVSDWHEVKG